MARSGGSSSPLYRCTVCRLSGCRRLQQ
jgi:hypothetical protein